MKKYLSLACLICLCFALISWGRTGHEAVALIAENHLTPQAKAAVKELLNGQSMSDVSNWADDVRDEAGYKSTAPWHYLNVPLGLSLDVFTMEAEGPSENNIYNAIIRSEHVLAHADNPIEKRVEALKFLIHLVGDAHQPMHISRKEDLGGNTISVKFDNKPTNLHALWDSKLIDHQGLSYEQMAKDYDTATPQQIKQWQKDDVVKWLYESYEVSTKLYSEVEQNNILDNTYYDQRIDIVKQRIEMAGIRLAGLLNKAFSIPYTVHESIPIDPTRKQPSINVKIELKDIAQYVGNSVVVSGEVYGIKDVGSMTLVDLGAAYPNQLATVVLRGEAKKYINADSINGKTITVTGTVSNYKGKSQIVVTDSTRLFISN